MRNYSSRILTEEETRLLSKGAGFAITPKSLPIEDFIVATEETCVRLSHKGEKDALRGEINRILHGESPPVSNISNSERKILSNLKKDESLVFLEADKGKCLVIMDKEEYLAKMEEKLADQTTYRRINENPTAKLQKRLWAKLEEIKNKKQISEEQFEMLKPHQYQIPRMSGRPKVHKISHPLREIVDNTGSVVKNTDKHISNIISKYAFENPYRLQNTEDFVNRVKDLKISEDETLVSYDIVAMYRSIPQEKALDMVYQKLINDDTLIEKQRLPPETLLNYLRYV